jgi:hypothetical protein
LPFTRIMDILVTNLTGNVNNSDNDPLYLWTGANKSSVRQAEKLKNPKWSTAIAAQPLHSPFRNNSVRNYPINSYFKMNSLNAIFYNNNLTISPVLESDFMKNPQLRIDQYLKRYPFYEELLSPWTKRVNTVIMKRWAPAQIDPAGKEYFFESIDQEDLGTAPITVVDLRKNVFPDPFDPSTGAIILRASWSLGRES